MNLSSKVQYFLEIQSQFKILHWQTKGYARHNAFGSIYGTLDGLIDNFIEISMGKFGRFVLEEGDKSLNLDNLQDVNIVQFLQEIKGFIISLTKELDPESDTDLLNLKDEMLGEINKLAYLLTLE